MSAPSSSVYMRLRRAILWTLLWVGLALCAAAVVRYGEESRDLLVDIGMAGLAGIFLLMLVAWMLAVASWRLVVAANAGEALSYSVAARHLALLLLGKYLPGGAWGFIARWTDSARDRSGARMFAAGICEQWLGLVSLSLLAGLGFLAAYVDRPEWLLLGVFIPITTVATLILPYWGMRLFTGVLPPHWRDLSVPTKASKKLFYSAAVLTTLQQTMLLMIVGLVAGSAFTLDMSTALAIASTYGLAVVGGILVVFMPGGILVREGIFLWAASQLLDTQQAIAMVAILRLMFTAFDLLAGVLAGGLRLRKVQQ